MSANGNPTFAQDVRLQITLAYIQSTGGEYSPEALAEYILKLEKLVLSGELW